MNRNKQPREILDPFLSPQEMCQDAGISLPTWRRHWRHRLPITWLSSRRMGVRQSDWQAALETQVEERS
jgi:hypothetical protein